MFSYVPWLSPLPPETVLAIFGSLMAIVEALNGLGVVFISNPTGNKQEAGRILVLASLGFQLCVIISFFVMSIIIPCAVSQGQYSQQGHFDSPIQAIREHGIDPDPQHLPRC